MLIIIYMLFMKNLRCRDVKNLCKDTFNSKGRISRVSLKSKPMSLPL